MNQEVSNKVFTIPNMITLARLLLLPVYIVLLLHFHNDVAAFLVFMLAACTDFIDGLVARNLNQISKIGQQLDPLVDRLLIISAVIVVFIAGRVPLWLVIVLLARDATMLVLTFYMKSKFNRNFKVVFVGKAATVFVMAGFCGLILNLPQVSGLGLLNAGFLPAWGAESAPIGIWFLYIGAVLAWIAGAIYLYKGTRPETRQDTRPDTRPEPTYKSTGSRNYYAKRNNAETRRSVGARSKGTSNNTLNGNSNGKSNNNSNGNYSGNSKSRANNNAKAKSKALANPKLGQELRPNTHSTKNGKQSKSISQASNKGQNPPFILRILNTPKKLLIAIAITIVIVVGAGFLCYDVLYNMDTIHTGVKVGNIDVGGLKSQEAAVDIDAQLNSKASSAPVILYASEQDKAKGVTDLTEQLDKGVGDYNAQQTTSTATSWSITTSTLGASSDGVDMANSAYAVGRDQDFIPGRLAANLFGVTIPAQLDFSKSKVENLESMLTSSIGTPMINANIVFNGSQFEAINGSDGYVVDEEKFADLLNKAYLGDNRDIVVPMVDRKMRIDLNAATAVAKTVNDSILEPVDISYENASWKLNKAFLGSCISTVVEQDSNGRWQLIPIVDPKLLEPQMPSVIGDLNPGTKPVNAKFEVVDGALQIVPGINGTGISYRGLAEQLTNVLFNQDYQNQPREAKIYIGTLEPDITTAKLREYDFSQKISEFTTTYYWASDNKITNIHLASELITSSLIAPGAIWSFNDTAGDCDAEKGFQEGTAVLDGELVPDIGGGICQVATTVFNVAFAAGYPIEERTNHGMYIEGYPDGRDAAIAYPYFDLKFSNDTSNWLLLVVSNTNDSITCSLWGISPEYKVEITTSEWKPGEKFKTKEVENPEWLVGERKVKEKGEDGKAIDVTRTVYDKDGNLLRQSVFSSVYEPKKEIVEIGTKKPEKSEAETTEPQT
ncbi:hypothetical protein FACS1894104_0060 [Actinomycetota bacterium]|nr:hypothetical protein FACS1894104_0060 [Actinomycetota bacterium]